MDLSHLQYFCMAAKFESLSKAANALFVNQSTLSKSISSLEHSVGTKLFDRVGNGMRLNKQGKIFLDYAERILELNSEALSKVLEADDSESGIVTYSIPSGGIIFDYERSFLINHPKAHLIQRVYNSEEAQRALDERSLDFAFSFIPISCPGIDWLPLKEAGFSVIMSSSHPLANRSGVFLKDLKDERFFTNNANIGSSQVISNLFKSAGFQPNIIFEGDDLLLSVEFIARQNVVSISVDVNYCSALGQTFYNHENGISVVPLLDDVARVNFGVARLHGRYMSRISESFYNHIIECIKL